MADLYTPSEDTLQRLAQARASDTAAARASLAGPIPPPPVPPTVSPTAVTPTAAAPAARPVSKIAYGAGRATGLIGGLAEKAAVVSPLAGFGDYQADTGGIDTSAGGTIGYLKNGEFANAGKSLSGGAAEALADSGRGIAKTVDGIAGYIGAKPGLTQSYDDAIKNNMGGYLSLRSATPPAGPIATAAGAAPKPVDARVAGVIAQMGGAPAAAAPAAPAAPAPAELTGGGYMGVPSTVDADRSFLAAAFGKHINGGDLERARSTVDPNNAEQMAQLGAAENAQVTARNAAYNAAPLERQIQDLLNRSPRERALDEDPRTRAFAGVSGGRRGVAAAPAAGNQDQVAGLIQLLANAQKGGNVDPAKAAADALTAYNNNQAAKTANAGAKVTQQGQAQIQGLQKQLLSETDPAKRATIQENIQTLTGKYEKTAAPVKAVIEDFDTGKVDMMGQPIYKKRAINPETGEPITKPAAAAKPTKAQLDAYAKDAIAKGANPDAVKKRMAEMAAQ